MSKFLNQLIDKASEFFASRKGLLPMLGILFVIANFIMQFYPSTVALADKGLLLHLGVILAVIGIMLAWAL
jgi:hypothetical protein